MQSLIPVVSSAIAPSLTFGRSKGGLSTKIHSLADTLGYPLELHLMPGQASDLVGSDGLLADLDAEALLADKGYDADERVIQPPLATIS